MNSILHIRCYMMLPDAVVSYGLMALIFISGVHTDENAPQIVKNCLERIDACNKIATTDDEIIQKKPEIVGCFTSFKCSDGKDDLRAKAMLELGERIALADSEDIPTQLFFPIPDVTDKSSNLAVIISFSYKTLVASTVAVFLLA
ncbi:unnamed protein product [Lymnaea stagnalis]|uniref:Uncharacterized protein n=1 Tax=Lymnaea stagnalis TaxID=6523 RepID=A0AAV2I8X2_LYMST